MQPLAPRARLVTGAFAVLILISAAAAYSDYAAIRFLQGVSDGEPVDETAETEISQRQETLGLAQLGLTVVCAVVFLMWFHRSHKNLGAAGLSDLRYSPAWAVGGFFVPFLNLVRPYHVMREVADGSAELAGAIDSQHADDAHEPVKPPVVGVWWALYLITSTAGYIAGHLALRAEGIDELLSAQQAMLVSDLIDIPAALAAVWLVRRVTQLQERARAADQKPEHSWDA